MRRPGSTAWTAILADQVDKDAIEHEGSIIATIVSPKDCGRCHTKEFKETEGSVHSKALCLIKQPHPCPGRII